ACIAFGQTQVVTNVPVTLGANYWNGFNSWAVGVANYIKATYGIPYSVLRTKVDIGPLPDPNTGLLYVEYDTLYSTQYPYSTYPFPLYGQAQVIFGGDVAPQANIILATVSNAFNLPFPSVVAPVAPAHAVVTTPPPINPIGRTYGVGNMYAYVAAGYSAPAGTTYTDQSGTVWVLQSANSLFGGQTF